MPLKYYGIYLAYPPTVDMRGQGLGRHLAMFLKGAENLPDIRFIIVCPSWTRETLDSLFESEKVSPSVVTIVAPEGKPYALRFFEMIQKYRARPKQEGWISRTIKSTSQMGERLWEHLTGRAVAVSDVFSLAFFLIESSFAITLLLPVLCLTLTLLVLLFLRLNVALMANRLARLFHGKFQVLLTRVLTVLTAPQSDNWVLRLYDKMQEKEICRMQAKIEALQKIHAWYCPTAFWPSFHDVKAPRLMCVPDVVLSDFPVGFASVGGDRFLSTFDSVELSIRNNENFLTYSEEVKWSTLVDRYAVRAENVTVIPHAPNLLNRYIEISGFLDVEAASRHFCQTLLKSALQRSSNPLYTSTFQNGDVKFLFYASQFRPNKNVLMLLRAFEFLLRSNYFGRKLILTGHPSDMPEIGRFVVDHRLENEVIFLPGLSVSELAACYKLADLAVNPTLSEGGCPFTFTEALSVGTPVVMSRIPVVEEILTESQVQEASLFNPFDWMDCAKRIQWAIDHREELLCIQLKTYALLSQRTWTDVVTEHVKVLDDISIRVLTT